MKNRKIELPPTLLEQMIATSTSGIVVTNPALPNNPIIFANKAFYEMTGYSEDETLGFNCRFLQREDTNQTQVKELRDAIKSFAPCAVTLRNYKKSGEMFWNELHINPHVDPQTNSTYFIGVQHDLTAAVELQQQRQTYNAGLIHDIKGPIYSQARIFRQLQQLTSDQVDELRHELIESLVSSAELVEKTLGLYKLENEIVKPQYSKFKAQDLVAKVCSDLKDLAASRQITLHILEPGAAGCDVFADYQMAYRALRNLIDNALKVSRINCTTSILISNTSTSSIIAVMDTGTGLPKPLKDALLARQDKLPSAFVSKDRESSGLGLITCAQIMRLHNGSLTLLKSNTDGTDLALVFPKTPVMVDDVIAFNSKK